MLHYIYVYICMYVSIYVCLSTRIYSEESGANYMKEQTRFMYVGRRMYTRSGKEAIIYEDSGVL